ncbi:MAG: 30S ribosomal protein S14 [Halorubrum sp.]
MTDQSTDDRQDSARPERRVCRVSGREQGLVGKYDIYLSRQAFREMARDMGFEKYD